jgi:hypothetical protein
MDINTVTKKVVGVFIAFSLTFSGFLAAYGFHDLNLLKHGHWLMRCYTFHSCMAYRLYVLRSVDDIYFDFFISYNGFGC